jgi:hypothetical protein
MVGVWLAVRAARVGRSLFVFLELFSFAVQFD